MRTFEVTQGDIECGEPGSDERCAVALAARRRFGHVRGVSFSAITWKARLTFDDRTALGLKSKSLVSLEKWLRDFDDKSPVSPIIVELTDSLEPIGYAKDAWEGT